MFDFLSVLMSQLLAGGDLGSEVAGMHPMANDLDRKLQEQRNGGGGLLIG